MFNLFKKKKQKIDRVKLLVSLLIPLAAGFIGSIFTTPSIASWYAYLTKPTFSPPNWIFAPVWTTLFILMGISLYLVWSKNSKKENTIPAVIFFLVHLVVNILWSVVFFNLHNPSGALIVISVLWIMIATLMIWFIKYSKVAAWILLPYLMWVSFASVLNAAVAALNI